VVIVVSSVDVERCGNPNINRKITMAAPFGAAGWPPALNCVRAFGPHFVQRSSATHSYTTGWDISLLIGSHPVIPSCAQGAGGRLGKINRRRYDLEWSIGQAAVKFEKKSDGMHPLICDDRTLRE
jgi:hypothetical protein